MELTGAVAIVTGAGGGIGSAMTRRLVEAGAQVVGSDLNADSLDQVVEDNGPAVAALVGDAAAGPHIAALVELAELRFGPVDLFVANAGVGLGATDLDASEAEWTTAWEVNTLAHVRAARLLMPGWLARGRGCFVVTASAAGLLTQLGSAPYTVSKHAAVAFAEWLAVTYGDRGIAVSCLCPMGVRTRMLDDSEREGSVAGRAVSAGVVLEPIVVADHMIDAIRTERFLVLPHPEVRDFVRRKAEDHDRWIRGMHRFKAGL